MRNFLKKAAQLIANVKEGNSHFLKWQNRVGSWVNIPERRDLLAVILTILNPQPPFSILEFLKTTGDFKEPEILATADTTINVVYGDCVIYGTVKDIISILGMADTLELRELVKLGEFENQVVSCYDRKYGGNFMAPVNP